jgi:hypothetical protein
MGSLSLDGLAIGAQQDAGHQTKRTEALRDRVGLHIAVVVLAGPHEATLALESIGNHVIDQAMLVPDASLLVLWLVLGLVDLLEDVLEATVVRLQDGVLGRKVHGPLLVQRVLEAAVRKVTDRLQQINHSTQCNVSTKSSAAAAAAGAATAIDVNKAARVLDTYSIGVVHAHDDTSGLKVEHIIGNGAATIIGRKDHLELATGGNNSIGSTVLQTIIQIMVIRNTGQYERQHTESM